MNQLGKTERDLIKAREDKRKKLEAAGIEIYPAKSDRNYTVKKVLDSQKEFIAGSEDLRLAGRIVSLRGHGAIIFADLVDESGKIQLFFKKDNLENDFKIIELLDIGDFIGATGKRRRSRFSLSMLGRR